MPQTLSWVLCVDPYFVVMHFSTIVNGHITNPIELHHAAANQCTCSESGAVGAKGVKYVHLFCLCLWIATLTLTMALTLTLNPHPECTCCVPCVYVAVLRMEARSVNVLMVTFSIRPKTKETSAKVAVIYRAHAHTHG